MTGTFPKNAGFTFFSGSQKARPLCGNPRRSFHFCGPSGFPLASQAVRGVSQDPRNLSGIARKLEENSGSRVHRLPVSQQTSFFRSAPGAPWEIHVHGRSSRELFGEIGLSEFRIVFAEVFICPETMRLLQESSRESHFEATVTRFEFPWRIGRKSDMRQVGLPRARALAFLH